MKKLDKIIAIIAIVNTILFIVNRLIEAFIKYRFKLKINNASGIGIIGGSDGPTSIFIADKNSGFLRVILNSCHYIAIASVLILIIRIIIHKRTLYKI